LSGFLPRLRARRADALRVAAVFVVALVCVAEACTVVARTDQLAVRDADAAISIERYNERLSQRQLYAALASAAQASHARLVKVQRSDGSGNRTLYALTGRQVALGAGQDFARSSRSRTGDPKRLLSLDVRGDYAVAFAERSAGLDAFMARLQAAGFQALPSAVSADEVLRYSLQESIVVLTAALLLGLLIMSCAASAYGARRDWAVQRANGVDVSTIRLRRLLTTALTSAGVMLGVLGAALLGLAAYNGGVRAGDVAATYALLAAAAMLVVLLADAIATRESTSGRLLDVVRGRSIGRSSVPRALAVKVISVVAVVVLLHEAGGAVERLRAVETTQGYWSRAGGLVALGHSPVLATFQPAELESYQHAFRRFVRTMPAHRRVLAVPQGRRQAPGAGYDPEGGNVLMVDMGYLRRFAPRLLERAPGLLPRRHRDAVTVTFLYPSRAAGSRRAFAQSLRRWFRFQARLDGTRASGPAVAAWHTRGVPLPPGSEDLFNLRVDAAQGLGGSISVEPIVVVIDALMPGVSADWLASASTRGQLLFAGRRDLRDGLEREHLLGLVPRAYGASDLANQLASSERNDAYTILAALLLAIACAGLTSLFAVKVYLDKVERRTVIERLNGVPLLRRHHAVLTASAGLLLCAGVAVYHLELGSTTALLVVVMIIADASFALRTLVHGEAVRASQIVKGAC
jgi:hypothetical protein